MRILIIEDEKSLAETIGNILKTNNYLVDIENDGESGYYSANTGIYDLVLLDIMLPVMDGLTVLKKLREDGNITPVILLTAKGEVSDKVVGLDLGADDYLPKPFVSEELLARIRANIRRRSETIYQDNLSIGNITLDKVNLKIVAEEQLVSLTMKEAELLEYLILNRNTTLSKDQILDKIWGYDSDANYNHVEVYISFLRKKLAILNTNVTLSTVRGVGYNLEVNSNV